jgi:hypothetical protein
MRNRIVAFGIFAALLSGTPALADVPQDMLTCLDKAGAEIRKSAEARCGKKVAVYRQKEVELEGSKRALFFSASTACNGKRYLALINLNLEGCSFSSAGMAELFVEAERIGAKKR